MNEEQLKEVANAKKAFNRGLWDINQVELRLENNDVPREEIDKVLEELKNQ